MTLIKLYSNVMFAAGRFLKVNLPNTSAVFATMSHAQNAVLTAMVTDFALTVIIVWSEV